MLVFAVYKYEHHGYSKLHKNSLAYPRFKKWRTNHDEREERGAEGDGIWGGGYTPSPELFLDF